MSSDLETFRSDVERLCAALPGSIRAEETDGEIPSWKVGGKMFACVGHKFQGVTVKCRDTETAAMLIDADVAEKAKYFHRSWVTLRPGTSRDELDHRITLSHEIILAGLPKRLRDTLAEVA